MSTPAPALLTLKRQLLERYPSMGAANLGIMADAAHIAAGTSDHIYGNALDIPVNGGPGAGEPMKALALRLLADPRSHYAIYNRVFYHEGRAPTVYTGESAHIGHIHLSIYAAKREDASPWAGIASDEEATVGYITLREGMTSPLVGELQERLRKTGAAVIPSNDYFDARTTQLVKNFQTSAGLAADGVVGSATWTKLIAVTAEVPVTVNAPVDSTLTAKAAKYDRIAAIIGEP
jgi:hypothetical protein